MTNHYTQENDQEIADLYRAGQTTYEIANRFGVSPTPIRRALDRQGVRVRKGGTRSNWANTTEERTAVIAAYEAGESINKMRRRLKVRAQVIIGVLNDAGVKRWHSGARPMFDEGIAGAIVAGYDAGAKLTDLAERFGTNHVTIRNYLVKRGVELRPPGVSLFWTPERKAEALRRYQSGESQQVIASDFGCSQVGVSQILRQLGADTRGPVRRRESHPSWRGGRTIDENGYAMVMVPDEDVHLVDVRPTGYVAEHRLAMARLLGRKLLPEENVHHIFGPKADNRTDGPLVNFKSGNLELWSSSQPSGQRVADKVEWAVALLREYAPELLASDVVAGSLATSALA